MKISGVLLCLMVCWRISSAEAIEFKNLVAGFNGGFITFGNIDYDDQKKEPCDSFEPIQTGHLEYHLPSVGLGVTAVDMWNCVYEGEEQTVLSEERYIHLFYTLQWIPWRSLIHDTGFFIGAGLGYSPISYVRVNSGDYQNDDPPSFKGGSTLGSATMTSLSLHWFPHQVIGGRLSFFQITTHIPQIEGSPEINGSGRGWTLSVQIRS